jgi:hypothetical protein
VFRLPTHLHISHTAPLYRYLEEAVGQLELGFENCHWADHFELQKLAVRLASLEEVDQLRILCPPSVEDPSYAPKSLEVIEYATRMNFFTLLHKVFGERLTVQFGGRALNAASDLMFRDDLLSALPPKRWETYHSKTYVPMQTVTDQLSVESMTKWFSTGAEIEELIEYYSELDFLTSGEFATLVVHELMQNIIDHAWITHGTRGLATVSLCTVDVGNRKNPEGRYQNRLRYAPEYEREFLPNLQGPGYLELCVSDAGMGIQSTLAGCDNLFAEWFSENHKPSSAELLAAAFWARVTRDPGPHRPGNRGLYYVAESVREYAGVLVCQSGSHELAIVANDPIWTSKYRLRSPFAFTAKSDVSTLNPRVQGTHYRILLPLSVPKRRRRYWDLKLSSPENFVSLTDSVILPSITSAPKAPTPHEMEDDVRKAMIRFRQNCRSALEGRPIDGIGGNSWVWLSCSTSRAWRKQHIHILLDEIQALPLSVVCLVNVPSSVFLPFVLVARHVTSTDQGKLILLLDENGRRGVICRDYDKLHHDFMHWAIEGSAFQPDASSAAQLLSTFIDEFGSSFSGLTLADCQFLMSGAGVEAEFGQMLEQYRSSTIAQISSDCFVEGYVEFDEALRDPQFFRAVASNVHLMRRFLLKGAGVVTVRRAATRIMQVEALPDDPNVWHMPTPDPKNAPPADWLLQHAKVCIITDVVCRGETLELLLKDLGLDSPVADSRVFCISPLVVQLLDQHDGQIPTPIGQTSVPGISELTLSTGLRVPIFSLIRTSAHANKTSHLEANKPEPTSNILFQSQEQSLIAKSGEISASDFIRLAERQRSLWLDHVIITDEHFDLEFNMIRLLRDGSTVVTRFCEQIADLVVSLKVDAIVFPDESRIHLALPPLEEALLARSEALPKTIRLRRSEAGNLFFRPLDRVELESTQCILLLDDAINSGGTAYQMLIRTLEAVPSAKHLHLQVLISRQAQHAEHLIQQASVLGGSSFSYSSFVRIPVPFYSAISCPGCRAGSNAEAVAAGLGLGSPVAAVLEDFATRMKPRYVYDGAPSRTDLEPALLYSIPSWSEKGHRNQQFTTLSGAKAALSCEIGADLRNISRLLKYLGEAQPLQFSLAAFGAYSVFSRSDIDGTVLLSPATQSFWAKACTLVHDAAKDFSVNRTLVSRAACELCLACWCAPQQVQWNMFVDLIQLSRPLLIDTEFYGWLIFLAFIIRQQTARNTEAQEAIVEALNEVRDRLIGNRTKKPSGLGVIESLMRVRQVIQAFSGLPITAPWLDGVIDLLELLSYKVGHTRRDYLTEGDVSWAESLLAELRLILLLEPPVGSGIALEIDSDLWDRLQMFLSRPHYYLGVLERSLTATLGGWFRAVEFSSSSAINISDVMTVARHAEKVAAELNELLDHALQAHRQREPNLLVQHLSRIAELERDLYESLYRKNVDNDFSFRTEVEGQLCHLHDLAKPYSESALRAAIRHRSGREIDFRGSMFEYFREVFGGGDESPRWCVLLCPRKLVDDILGDILIDNLCKHVLSSLPKSTRVLVQADIEGIGSVDHRLLIKISIFINGRPFSFPKNMLNRTLGKNKDTMLRLYGGNIHIDDQSGRTQLTIAFLSGHF